MVTNNQQTTTTVTTKTTEVPVETVPVRTNVVEKDAVVTNVLEKPVLQNVIEKKNVEVHHKPVVQEIHEQKIIEIQKQPVVQNVVEQPVLQQSRAETTYQEIGTGALGEQERLRLEKLRLANQPVVKEQQSVQQYQERETVGQVVKQEFIERHVQPVVTEVREQNVVQEVLHPVVRKIHEAPIVREVHSSAAYTVDTGRFAPLQAKFVPSATQHTQTTQNPNLLHAISGAGKSHFWGLSNAGELYHLAGKDNSQAWTHVPANNIRLRDISVGRGGALFGVGLNDGALYRYTTHGFEPVLQDNTHRFSQLSVQSKRKIYALTEDGSAVFIKLARFGHNHTFERLGGKLRKISSGGRLLRRTEVWGIGVDNRAYRWFDNNWVPYNVELRDLSVAMDNAVYGVSREGRLLKWDGHDQFLLQDSEIRGDNAHYLSNARLTNVSAYKEGKGVYGLEEGTSNVLKMLV